MIRVAVTAGGVDRSYPVLIGCGARASLAQVVRDHADAARVAVISDERVAGLYGADIVAHLQEAAIPAELFRFPEGESSKQVGEWRRLGEALLAGGHGRDTCVVALGGGVTGDLAGFVAATHMRGVPVVQVPTSILAMVDASVGGKTGINTPQGKNLVGAFHPPRAVLIDPEFVATLARDARAQGLAEAVKHAAIQDADYGGRLEAQAEALLDGSPERTQEAVTTSVRIKAAVVTEDERESGRREVLNFGHTLGHAFEAASAYRLPHGSAVAIGMVAEAEMGVRLGHTHADTPERLRGLLRRFELPVRLPEPPRIERILAVLDTDKKARRGNVRTVLLERFGQVRRWDADYALALPNEDLGALVRDAVETVS